MDYPCERCRYGEAEHDEIFCTMLWAEDVEARAAQGHYTSCPYFYPGDDYTIVRRQN